MTAIEFIPLSRVVQQHRLKSCAGSLRPARSIRPEMTYFRYIDTKKARFRLIGHPGGFKGQIKSTVGLYRAIERRGGWKGPMNKNNICIPTPAFL